MRHVLISRTGLMRWLGIGTRRWRKSGLVCVRRVGCDLEIGLGSILVYDGAGICYSWSNMTAEPAFRTCRWMWTSTQTISPWTWHSSSTQAWYPPTFQSGKQISKESTLWFKSTNAANTWRRNLSSRPGSSHMTPPSVPPVTSAGRFQSKDPNEHPSQGTFRSFRTVICSPSRFLIARRICQRYSWSVLGLILCGFRRSCPWLKPGVITGMAAGSCGWSAGYGWPCSPCVDTPGLRRSRLGNDARWRWTQIPAS